MAFFDLPLEQLKTYKPERQEPQDFDQFWKETLDETAQFPLDAKFEPVNYHLKTVEAFDLTFNGFGGQPIKGWLMLPKQRSGKIPCVVEFIGYGGGRNHPFDWLLWSSAGYAHLVMDTRGQGTSWSTGSTPDVETEPGNPHYPGFMTKGILSPQTYYYRRLMTDGVRAVEAAKAHPAVDPAHVATVGTSQGGGLSLAVGGLSPQVEYVIADVPFLCHYRRATQITDAAPYLEISRYCQRHRDKIDTVFNTLSYFDGVNFATRIKGESMVSVGLMDEICPPSTVFAAYNYIPGKKQLNIWEYNHHEGGESYNILEKLKFLGERWG